MPFDSAAVHGSLSAELEELASAFALEALLPEEADGYGRHLQGCQFCRRLVAECQAAADLLPLALEQEEGSPALKQRILAQAAQESAPRGEAVVDASEETRARRGIRWPAWMALNPAIAATAAVVMAGLVAWNIVLQLDAGEPNQLSAQQLNLIEMIGSGATIIELTGTEAAPDAGARLIQTPGSDIAFLLPRNLPLLDPGQEFEVWSIRGGVAISVGTFGSNGGQKRLVSFVADVTNAEGIGVSIEQKGGSPTGKPLGPAVLQGSP